MKTVVVIQARLGSSRLPGKVLFPLNGKSVLVRILQRLKSSSYVDNFVVATTEQPHDEVISWVAQRAGANTHQGNEKDVLDRIYHAALKQDADAVVRVCADTPFVSHRIIDPCIRALETHDCDYVSTKLDRTFPIGYGAEAFSMDSFERVNKLSIKDHEREHVTVRYRENRDNYSRIKITSEDIFAEEKYKRRGDLRLTLDVPADYQLIQNVYENMNDEEPTIEQVIDFIDDNDLANLNTGVDQKSMYNTEDSS